MNSNTINELAKTIEAHFGSPCTFVRAERVQKQHKGRMIWKGTVGIFRLARDGRECYAWADDMLVGFSSPVIMTASPTIATPAEAVESYILGLCDGAMEASAHAPAHAA